jgi:hypothetical protein
MVLVVPGSGPDGLCLATTHLRDYFSYSHSVSSLNNSRTSYDRLWDTWEIFDRTSSKEIKWNEASMENIELSQSYVQTMCISASLSLL